MEDRLRHGNAEWQFLVYSRCSLYVRQSIIGGPDNLPYWACAAAHAQPSAN